MYLQLPSLSGGRSSIRNLSRTRHVVVTATHLSRTTIYYISKSLSLLACKSNGNCLLFFRVIFHSRVVFQHDIPYPLILPFRHCPQSASFPVTLTTAVNAVGALALSGFFFSFRRFVLLPCPLSILRISYVS